MTKEEIKQSYSMADIVERYGFRPDRLGFIKCPFHKGDNHASLKIYKDSFYCFGCGVSGDIFKFVMLIDDVSFRDAFLSLGGTYDKAETKNEARHIKRDIYNAGMERKRQDEILAEKKRELEVLNPYLTMLVCAEKKLEPFSDIWCTVVQEMTKTYIEWLELWEEVNGNGTSEN